MKHQQSSGWSRVNAREGAASARYSDHAPFHRVCFPLRRIIEFGPCAIEISSRANKYAEPPCRSATNFSFVSETSRRDDANMSPRGGYVFAVGANSATSKRKEVKTLLGSAGAEERLGDDWSVTYGVNEVAAHPPSRFRCHPLQVACE